MFSRPRLNIGPISIRFSKRIGRYPVVSVDQVRFCGKLLFFFPPFLVLGWVQSLEEPSFYLSFFSSLLFPLFDTLHFSPPFFCPTLISSSHFPLAVFSRPRLNIGPISIRFSKRIGRYPVVSVDQVRFCGKLLFFFSLPFLSSDGFSPWKSPLFTYHFFLPFFSPSLIHLIFPLLFFVLL